MDDALALFYEHHRVRRPRTRDATDTDPLELVIFDMDGVLIDAGSSWVMVHQHFGVHNQDGLRAFLEGKIDDHEFIRSDVQKWQSVKADVSRADLEEILRTPPYVEGVFETVQAVHDAGIKTAIVSGGIDIIANRIAVALGIRDCYANGFEFERDGRLTGGGIVRTPLADKARPIIELQEKTGIPLERMLSIGNSVPDVPMFELTGRSIAFHPEDDYTRQHATHVIESGPLTQILPFLNL